MSLVLDSSFEGEYHLGDFGGEKMALYFWQEKGNILTNSKIIDF